MLINIRERPKNIPPFNIRRSSSEKYREGDLEAHIHFSVGRDGTEPTYYCAIFNRLALQIGAVYGEHRARVGNISLYASEIGDASNQENVAMFVGAVHSMEKPERVIRSVIRVLPLNECPSVLPEWFESVPTTHVEFSAQENGEFGLRAIGRRAKKSEVADQVVKSGTNVVHNVSDNQRPVVWDGDKMNMDIVMSKCRVEVSNSSVGAFFEEPRDFSVQFLQVMICTAKFEFDADEVGHMLYSKREGQEDDHAKDTEAGIRNPRANKGRRVQGTGKGGGANQAAQALNSQTPPEEVASQTEHGHPLCGYTAKHTHSGSLEDA